MLRNVNSSLNENGLVVGTAKVGNQSFGWRNAVRPKDGLKVLAPGLVRRIVDLYERARASLVTRITRIRGQGNGWGNSSDCRCLLGQTVFNF